MGCTTPPRPILKHSVPQPPSKMTPEWIRPLPKADFTKMKSKTTSRKKGKTAVLTDTPEKLILEQRYNQRLVTAAKKTVVKEKRTKRSAEYSKKLKIGTKRKKAAKKEDLDTSSSDDNEEETFCLVCLGSYEQSKEDWLQCRTCKLWAHSSCAKNDPLFICHHCLSD